MISHLIFEKGVGCRGCQFQEQKDSTGREKGMDRDEIIRRLAEYYRIEPDEETGEYDLDDYDWQSGCSKNGRWLCLAEIVEALTD